MVEDIKEHKVSVMASVPAIYEGIFKNIRKQLEKQGKLQEILEKEELCKNLSMEEKKKAFKEIHDMLGGNMKLMISGAASLNSEIEERYRKLISNINEGLVFSRDGDKIWQCRNCGHIVIGKEAPKVCPVCAHPQSYFEIKKENY